MEGLAENGCISTIYQVILSDITVLYRMDTAIFSQFYFCKTIAGPDVTIM